LSNPFQHLEEQPRELPKSMYHKAFHPVDVKCSTFQSTSTSEHAIHVLFARRNGSPIKRQRLDSKEMDSIEMDSKEMDSIEMDRIE
jgi:hypothetical protein